MLAKKELLEIEKRLSAITPGEWKERHHPSGEDAFVEVEVPGRAYGIEVLGDDKQDYPTWREDVAFVAAAPSDMRRLLQEIRRLKATVGLLLLTL